MKDLKNIETNDLLDELYTRAKVLEIKYLEYPTKGTLIAYEEQKGEQEDWLCLLLHLQIEREHKEDEEIEELQKMFFGEEE